MFCDGRKGRSKKGNPKRRKMPRRSNQPAEPKPEPIICLHLESIEFILGLPATPEQFPSCRDPTIPLSRMRTKEEGVGRPRRAINFLAYRDPTARHPKNLTRGKGKESGAPDLVCLSWLYHFFVMFGSSIEQMGSKEPQPALLRVPATQTRYV